MSSQESKPIGSVAVSLQRGQRAVAWIVMVVAFGFGGWLAAKNYNGISTASVFAIGLLFAIAALGGVLPTSIKVGDVQLAIQKAAADGLVKGAGAAQQVAQGAEPQQLASQVVSETLPSSLQADVRQQVVDRLNDVAAAQADSLVKGAEAAQQVANGGEPGQAASQVVSDMLPSSLQSDARQQVVERLNDVAEARDSMPTPQPPQDGQPATAGPAGGP